MGEVYRARDSRLGRDVALKILPDHLGLDTRHLARFKREARLLAALNHPNIAAIYGLEESEGRQALVLELVEGVTLAKRIAEGPLPFPQALAIARQIADALDVAHEQGIVHRDLKPDNITVRPDGMVKVLDFGVAKTFEVESGKAVDPTITIDTAVIGTTAYASPEQARGIPVDRRTDIWAFGCVLYEMLTSRRAFEGETTSDVIVSILERAPDWEALPPETPPLVRRLLQHCLEKDLGRRLRNIGDARVNLEEPLLRQRRRRWMTAGLSAALAAVVALALGLLWLREDPGTDQKSIVVLPFTNISGDPSQEHLADGLTDELLNSLATIDELRVISRTSSFALKRRNPPLSEVAATLGVSHVLEGSLRRAGDRIRVTAQLIDARSDSHLWSESYDRDLTLGNILQIQEEIALRVADALEPKLFPRTSDALRGNQPDNLAALDLYHEGMFYVRQIETGQGDENVTTYQKAIETLEASIKADPEWAPAHAALGEVYHFWIDAGDATAKLRTAKRHIMEAIRLDDTYGPAYVSLGYILSVERDYEGAMRAYDRSISLGGWPAGGPWGKAIVLKVLGRYNEAVEEYREALARDPLSTMIRSQLVAASYCAGRYAEVIDGSLTFLSILPDDRMEFLLASAHARIGDLEKALQIADAQADRTGTEAPFALTFALAGQEERARSALSALERNEPGFPRDAVLEFALPAALALGEEDRALTILEQLTTDADLAQSFFVRQKIRCHPEVRSLAGNPRYEAVLDRLGL